MKYIEVDEELYRHIASKTERIGESASDILRRLLGLSVDAVEQTQPQAISQPSLEAATPEPQVAPQVETLVSATDFNQLVDEHKLAQQKGAVGRFLFCSRVYINKARRNSRKFYRSKVAIDSILRALGKSCSRPVLPPTRRKSVIPDFG